MNDLQKKAEKAWDALEDQCDLTCNDCPLLHVNDCGEVKLQFWLLGNGFPVSRPHVYTEAELARQMTEDRGIGKKLRR